MIKVSRAFLILAFIAMNGCAVQPDNEENIRAYTDEYVAGDASLTVSGYGEWNDTNARLAFEYQHGEHHQHVDVDFARWNLSGDPAISSFFSSVDQPILATALEKLQATASSHDTSSAMFRHFQTRLLSDQMPHSHNAEATKDCYCYYCGGHHQPVCVSSPPPPTK